MKKEDGGWIAYLPSYLGVIHIVLALCLVGYSIYWMIICAATIWVRAVGAGIVAVNFFICLCSLIATLGKICGLFKVMSQLSFVWKSCEVIGTILALVFCAVAISLATYAKADRYYQEILAYCQGNNDNAFVVEFLSTYSTYHSVSEYIHNRSTDASTGIEALLGCLVTCFVFEISLGLFDLYSVNEQDKPLLDQQEKENYEEEEHAEEDNGQSNVIDKSVTGEDEQPKATVPKDDQSHRSKPMSKTYDEYYYSGHDNE